MKLGVKKRGYYLRRPLRLACCTEPLPLDILALNIHQYTSRPKVGPNRLTILVATWHTNAPVVMLAHHDLPHLISSLQIRIQAGLTDSIESAIKSLLGSLFTCRSLIRKLEKSNARISHSVCSHCDSVRNADCVEYKADKFLRGAAFFDFLCEIKLQTGSAGLSPTVAV